MLSCSLARLSYYYLYVVVFRLVLLFSSGARRRIWRQIFWDSKMWDLVEGAQTSSFRPYEYEGMGIGIGYCLVSSLSRMRAYA